MKMIHCFIFFLIALLYPACSAAQTAQPYIYQDSSILFDDSNEDSFDDEEDTAVYNTFTDTALTSNGLFIAADSVEKIKNEKAFTYTKNLDSILKKLQANEQISSKPGRLSWFEKFLNAPVTNIIFWILAIAFVLFILFRLFLTEGIFIRSPKKNTLQLLTQDETKTIADTDFDALMRKAADDKDFRLALRYLYLQALQLLLSAEVIQFALYKTNSQYSRELAIRPYRNIFDRLTGHYEYAWYGGFSINETQFAEMQATFKQLKQQVQKS